MVRIIVAAIAIAVALGSDGLAQQATLYDFYSPSCGPCRRMEPTVHQLSSAGYPVRKVNIMGSPADQALAAKFRVSKVPTFVTAVDGREVDRVVGATSYSHLEQLLRRASQLAQDARPPEDPVASRMQSPDRATAHDPWAAPPGQSPANYKSGGTASQTPAWPIGGRELRQPSANPQAQAATGKPLNDSEIALLQSTVRLRVQDGDSHSWGTGTIIDARSGEALVITCGHIFRDSKGKGPLIVEVFAATPQGVRVSERVAGQVISYDMDRDVGLVSFKPQQKVRVAKVASSDAMIAEQRPVASAGCDHGADPTIRHSHITALNRYLGEPNIEVAGAPVEGRSGGGLFNEAGELIGICNAADPEGNEGLFAGLPSVHGELDKIGLAEIYRNNQPALPSTALAETNPFGDSSSNLTNPEPTRSLQAVGPPRAISLASRNVKAASPGRETAPALNATEQAAWEEIMGRASEAEVVCIIRPKVPGGKSEVITLNTVSADFVRRIVSQQKPAPLARTATEPTSYPVAQ